MNDLLYQCKFCKKRFTLERAFMKHRCTPMDRAEEIQTITGQTAYGLYKYWLERQRRQAPPVDTFLTSSYYTSFINFATWFKSVGLPDPQKYVELMIDSKISPALWRRDEAYKLYLEHLDKKSTPIQQATTTIETILALAEGLECNPNEVFSNFQVGDILELIHQRRLSPWLLFCSKSFKEWCNKLHPVDKTMLMSNIGVEYWADRMEKNPTAVKELVSIAESLEI